MHERSAGRRTFTRAAVVAPFAIAIVAAASQACGSSEGPPPTGGDAGVGDAAGDAASIDAATEGGIVVDAGDAGDPGFAQGTRILPRPATLEGLTSDGFVAFAEGAAESGKVAKVMAGDGTGETSIAEGTGADKAVLVQAIGKVVFAWTNRGNRTSTLAVWSKTTGVLAKGSGVRPGRAAASVDGASIGYVRDVTASTANVVVGPIGADAPAVIGALNAADDTCWKGVDLAFVGQAAPRFVSRYCTGATTAFALRSSAPDGATTVDLSAASAAVTFGKNVVVEQDVGGALRTSAPDGSGAVVLATNVASHALSHDESLVAFRTVDDSIVTSPARVAQPHVVVPAGQGKRLGALSHDNQRLLFASLVGDAGASAVDTPTDVLAAAADGGILGSIVATPTSCPDCLLDSFTDDSSHALVIAPIDDSVEASGSGPLHAYSFEGGAPVTFGGSVWTVLAVGGAGDASRLLVIEIHRASALETGFAYDLYTRTLAATDSPAYIARGAERVAVDAARSVVFFSIPGTGPYAGIWSAPLR